jgi:U4/U6.U5 tri-snRNP component SNU23
MRSGLSGEVKRATLEDVQDRLRYLSRKRKDASKVETLDLDKRLDERKEEEERTREEKRRKRNEKRRSKKQQDDW